MTEILKQTSELTAVNLMLGAIGESRVSSLEGGGAVVAMARTLLEEVKRAHLNQGARHGSFAPAG